MLAERQIMASASTSRRSKFTAYLYVSRDYGQTWTPLAGNLPAEPINVVGEDPKDARILYVGTDSGVYASVDRGLTWISLSAALPAIPVHDLVVHPRESDLVIATHGRSIYVADISAVRALR
jgi:photosystem II stability/assembly factor-like uncharacterized protein